MLHFFRKYQKIFFLFTTVIIVSSFAFFGTYQAMAPAFMRGNKEERISYPSQVAQFLSSEQWMVSRKVFSSNFLNDGVISKEFLETNIADLIVEKFADRFSEAFTSRLEEEKSYMTYSHPYLPALTAESIWSVFAPNLPEKLKAFQTGSGNFKQRKELFLAQKQFPPNFLTQVIRYQEQNNPQFPGDPRLAKDDIALFGYHNISDWFGEEFVGALSQIIIQTAQIARKEGYKVSKDEVIADLLFRSEETYQILKNKVNLPVEDGYGLFQLYLRQIGMSEATVFKIWEDVMLFRRLMHEIGSAVMVDSLPLSEFYAYAYENVTVELLQMAPELRFQSFNDLKKFETYLAAVAPPCTSPSDIPLEYAPIETIEMRAPELVGKQYQLYFSEVSKEKLQAKVSIKETLQWECDLSNWEMLQKQFPDLAEQKGAPFDVLEQLDPKVRKRIDTFARKQIVEKHPEWVEEALIQANMDEKELFLSSTTEKPFEGISDAKQLSQALDTQDEIIGYTQDDKHFYRFLVRERGEGKHVLTFKQASKNILLDSFIERMDGEGLAQKFVETTAEKDKDMAPAYRFVDFLSQHKDQAMEGGLAQQFKIEKIQKTLTRSEKSFISIDEALVLEEGTFSEVKVDPQEGAYIYRFLERKNDRTLPMDKIVQTQELLSQEARYHYFEKLLTQLNM